MSAAERQRRSRAQRRLDDVDGGTFGQEASALLHRLVAEAEAGGPVVYADPREMRRVFTEAIEAAFSRVVVRDADHDTDLVIVLARLSRDITTLLQRLDEVETVSREEAFTAPLLRSVRSRARS